MLLLLLVMLLLVLLPLVLPPLTHIYPSRHADARR